VRRRIVNGEATSPGSAIVPGVFGEPSLSDASKPPGSDAGSPFGLEEQVPGDSALTVKKDHQHALDVRPTFESREPLKSLCPPYGIITRSCFEHFMLFRCSFPEFKAKFHANALLFKISHFAYNQKSRIALNTHNNKQSLRSNTKGYGGKTH
jgi:hypothetical protein